MPHFITKIKRIPIEDIINKYTTSEIIDDGSWKILSPCPRCRHQDCCKINLDNNTLTCFSEGKHYLSPIKVVMWLMDLEYKDAVIKLAEDFQISLSADWEKEMTLYLKRKRRYAAFTAFAEECHSRLSAEDRHYWISRGFSDDTIDKVQIGKCRRDRSTIEALIKKGFSEDELAEFGLVVTGRNGEFIEYYANSFPDIPYYTLPNWNGSQVIDIQGRCSVKSEDFPKYLNTKGTVGALYNPSALKEEMVFIAEGVPDTLSLLQMGFSACGAYGAGNVKDEWIPSLQSRQIVYIAFDRDKAGIENAYKLARSIGETAKIISLTEGKDINELLVKHGTEKASEIIKELMRQAKTALEMDIDALPSHVGEIKNEQMKDIAFQILDLLAFRQPHYLERLRRHLGVDKKVIADTLRDCKPAWNEARKQGKNAKEPQPVENVLLISDPLYIRLSQSFALNKAFYAQEFLANTKCNGNSYPKRTIHIVTSDRQLLSIPKKVSDDPAEVVQWEVAGERLMLRRPLTNATRRWSKTGTRFSVDRFLNSEEDQVNIVDLYKQIEAVYRRYYYTEEQGDYVILTLFTIFTYYFEIYDVVPYLYLNGQPETGKTTICVLMQNLAFNGDLVSNISTAALFREAEQKQPTFILDEQEGIASRKANDDKSDYLSIMKDAYKRTGTVKRQSIADSSITEEFMVFNPMIIANVMGLEDIVKTRTISISTKAAPSQATSGIETLRSSSKSFLEEAGLIRDQIYCWVMQNHEELRKLLKVDIKNILNNRAEELFQPMFALASLIDASDKANGLKLIEQLQACLPNKLMRRDSVRTRDMKELLRDACLELLASEGIREAGHDGVWISGLAIFDKLVELNGQYMTFMTAGWIGEKITEANFMIDINDKRRGRITTVERDPRTNLPTNSGTQVDRKVTQYYLRYERIARQSNDAN